MTQQATLTRPTATRAAVISGDALEPAMTHLGAALLSLTAMRSLVHAHSKRDVLTINADAVQYLLEERDTLVAEADRALLAYAQTVDPTGSLRALVEMAIAPAAQPERIHPPVARLMRRGPDGVVREVQRFNWIQIKE